MGRICQAEPAKEPPGLFRGRAVSRIQEEQSGLGGDGFALPRGGDPAEAEREQQAEGNGRGRFGNRRGGGADQAVHAQEDESPSQPFETIGKP